MTEFIDFELTSEDYMKIANEAISDGDAVKGIAYLNKLIKKDPKCMDAYIKLASLYRGYGATDIAISVLFKALDVNADDEDSCAEAYHRLGIFMLEIGDYDAAEFYLYPYFDDFVEEFEESSDVGHGKFRVVYPKGEEYYEGLLERAYELMQNHRFDKALKLLELIDPDSKHIDAANHAKLVCMMLTKNPDAVIDSAKAILCKTPDNLAVRCTMITALAVEERLPEAYAELDALLEKDYDQLEQIILILPLLVQLNMHVYVVKYIHKLPVNFRLQPNIMFWLSEALYNLGQREEARKIMLKADRLYGDYVPTDFYLKLYEIAPESVEYCISLPPAARMERLAKLAYFLSHAKDEDCSDNSEFSALMRWAICDSGDNVCGWLLEKLVELDLRCSEKFVRDIMLTPDIDIDDIVLCVEYLIKKHPDKIEFNAVLENKFKVLSADVPDILTKSYVPRIFVVALYYCIAIAAQLSDGRDFDFYVHQLEETTAAIDENTDFRKFKTCRSPLALAFVIMNNFYDTDDDFDEALKAAHISRRTYEKYNKICEEILFKGE